MPASRMLASHCVPHPLLGNLLPLSNFGERVWELRERQKERDKRQKESSNFPRGSFGKDKNSSEKPQRKLRFRQDSAPSVCHSPGQLVLSTCSLIHPRHKSTQLLQRPSLPHLPVLFLYFLTSLGEPRIWCGKLWAEGISLQNYPVDRAVLTDTNGHIWFLSSFCSIPGTINFTECSLYTKNGHSLQVGDGETESQGLDELSQSRAVNRAHQPLPGDIP